jgi:hypothetical protein
MFLDVRASAQNRNSRGLAVKTVLAIAVIVGAVTGRSGQNLQAVSWPVLNVVPSIHASRTPQAFLDACFNMGAWPTVLANATYLGVSDAPLDNNASDGDKAACFSQMNAHGVQLSLEIGAVKGGCSTDGNCYNQNYFHWSHFQDLGAPQIILRMDEPLWAVWSDNWFGPNKKNLSYAVTKTADWIQNVRSDPRFAAFTIVDIEPFPASGDPGDAVSVGLLTQWMNALHAECAARGIACAQVFEVDHQIETGGSVYDLQNLMGAAHNVGMAFSVIYTNAYGSGGSSNNCDFAQAIENRGAAYVNSGGVPFVWDWFTIESWEPNPSTTVPELGGGCTFMRAVNSFMDDGWYPLTPFPQNVNFQASVGGQYWRTDGVGDVRADSDQPEWITVFDNNRGSLMDGDQIRLRFGGQRIMAEAGVPPEYLFYSASGVLEWETFTIIDLSNPGGQVRSGDQVALQSFDGHYVCAEGGGNGPLTASRSAIGPWETFYIWF